MAESLRDQLEAEFDKVIPETQTPAPQETPAETPAEVVSATPETPEPEKPGRTAGRPRDEKGRLLPGPAQKTEVVQAQPQPEITTQAVVEPPKPLSPRPSSWKKDYEGHWQKLDPELQKYLVQRESEFANGVSTYKREFDQLKPLAEAMEPFMPLLQQHGMQPSQWLRQVGETHKMFVQGSPEQKLGMLMRLAQDYQIPIQNLFVQGQDGRLYQNPNVQAYQPVQQRQTPDVRAEIQAVLMQEKALQSLAEFEKDVPTKYPHYETVKEDMALLLESGKAPDYPSAYEKALRLHDDLWKAQQDEQRQADEAERLRKSQEAALRARRNNVSPRSSTPAGKPASTGKRSLRDQLSEAFDEHVDSGRV